MDLPKLSRNSRVSIAAAGVILLLLITGFLFIRNENSGWRAAQDRLLPQFMPAGNKELIPLIARPFSDDIDIGVVIDHDQTYDFVDPGRLVEWEVDEDTLYEVAFENLEKISKAVSLEVAETTEGDPSGTYVILELQDGYAAARLLSNTVRKTIAKELGDEYVVAIPTRDFLIAWHRDFPLEDPFLNQVQIEYDAEPTYKLTPNPFLVTKDGIQPLKKQEVQGR